MAKQYRQLTYLDRMRIEEGLNSQASYRTIAQSISRDVATVSREVKSNRTIRAAKTRKVACRDKNWCVRTGVCGKDCVRAGAKCAGCDVRDCRDVCPAYAKQGTCGVLTRAPWVCNGCRKNHYGCNRSNRWIYSAKAADEASRARRSESRQGIDMDKNRAEMVLARIKEGLSRNLSPYEISQLYSQEVGVSASTIYRWVQSGYGGLANLELERKVGFKPRSHTSVQKSTSHSKKRSHDAFIELPQERQDSTLEMDCVEGRAADMQCILTLYLRTCHLQLALLLDKKKDCECVKERLCALRSVCEDGFFEMLCQTVLTDNGSEFRDEEGLGAIFGEGLVKEPSIRLFYCDPRRSDQKAGCEKNHTEIRQLLKKGCHIFDELVPADMVVLMSHVNSNPRASLCGMSPIQMFKAAYGQAGEDFLDALGICQIGRDELRLTPDILDIERERRGEAPLTRMK